MKRCSRRKVLAAIPVLPARLLAATGPTAATPVPDLPPAVPVSLVVANAGDAPDRIRSASSPLADAVEFRSRVGFGANQREIRLPDGITIPGEATVILEALGEHLALVGLRQDLVQGQTFQLDLIFERAGQVTVTGRVRRRQDAAGIAPIPPAVAGDLTISLVSAPPAPAVPPATPQAG
jgi:copper(I)-binding protein